MSEIATKVKAIIVDKLGVDEKEVTPTASFTNDLGADSFLDLLQHPGSHQLVRDELVIRFLHRFPHRRRQ